MRCSSSRPTTTSRRRKASTGTSRRSTTRSSIPIIIYNIPGRSVVDMTVETMTRCYALKNVVGVKDATANLARASQQRAAMGPEFNMLSGEDATALGFMAHGGHGCISVTSNIAPRLCAEFQNACLKGDYKRRAGAAGPADAAARRAVLRDQPGPGEVRRLPSRTVRGRHAAAAGADLGGIQEARRRGAGAGRPHRGRARPSKAERTEPGGNRPWRPRRTMAAGSLPRTGRPATNISSPTRRGRPAAHRHRGEVAAQGPGQHRRELRLHRGGRTVADQRLHPRVPGRRALLPARAAPQAPPAAAQEGDSQARRSRSSARA